MEKSIRFLTEKLVGMKVEKRQITSEIERTNRMVELNDINYKNIEVAISDLESSIEILGRNV